MPWGLDSGRVGLICRMDLFQALARVGAATASDYRIAMPSRGSYSMSE